MSIKISDSTTPQLRLPTPPGKADQVGTGFAAKIGKQIEAVESLQDKADLQAQKLALGEANLHETALALGQADLAVRLMVKVRNKVVDAYQEIMHLSV